MPKSFGEEHPFIVIAFVLATFVALPIVGCTIYCNSLPSHAEIEQKKQRELEAEKANQDMAEMQKKMKAELDYDEEGIRLWSNAATAEYLRKVEQERQDSSRDEK